jgi:hypothetical protein
MFSIRSITHFLTSYVSSFGNFILACAEGLVVFSKIFECTSDKVQGQSVLAETLEKVRKFALAELVLKSSQNLSPRTLIRIGLGM